LIDVTIIEFIYFLIKKKSLEVTTHKNNNLNNYDEIFDFYFTFKTKFILLCYLMTFIIYITKLDKKISYDKLIGNYYIDFLNIAFIWRYYEGEYYFYENTYVQIFTFLAIINALKFTLPKYILFF